MPEAAGGVLFTREKPRPSSAPGSLQMCGGSGLPKTSGHSSVGDSGGSLSAADKDFRYSSGNIMLRSRPIPKSWQFLNKSRQVIVNKMLGVAGGEVGRVGDPNTVSVESGQ